MSQKNQNETVFAKNLDYRQPEALPHRDWLAEASFDFAYREK